MIIIRKRILSSRVLVTRLWKHAAEEAVRSLHENREKIRHLDRDRFDPRPRRIIRIAVDRRQGHWEEGCVGCSYERTRGCLSGRTYPSKLAEIKYRSSRGWKAMAETKSTCRKKQRHSGRLKCHKRTVLSIEEERRNKDLDQATSSTGAWWPLNSQNGLE